MYGTSGWWAPAALYGTIAVGCIALFLAFYALPKRWFPQPLPWLGKISYGLYLYHSLVIAVMPQWRHGTFYSVMRTAAELQLTILAAALSYYGLERPFLRWKESFTFVPSRPA